MIDLKRLLALMMERNASDIFLSVGAPIHIKIEGVMSPITDKPLPAGAVEALAQSIMNPRQAEAFHERPEMNLALAGEHGGRFRVNIYRQRGEVSMVVRYLKEVIPSLEELNLPPILKQLVMDPRGLVLVVGATGSGKSTTLASMINYRNQQTTGHIVTIEDPIEYVHSYQRSVVEQREVGFDTLSYADALKNAMREAPDVILIGEVRDRANMEHAVAYAETGHLCLTTLHASNAHQALERIVTFFPESMHRQLFMDLSLNLRAIISQRLITGVDGKRVPAMEILISSPRIADLIQKGEIELVRSALEKSPVEGTVTFDRYLFQLYMAGKISREEALRNAESANNLALLIRLQGGRKAMQDEEGMSLVQEEKPGNVIEG